MSEAPVVLSRAAIAGIDQRPIELFHVPEFNGSLRLRPLSLADMIALAGLEGTARSREIVRRGLVDEGGNPMYAAADADEMLAWRGDVIVRIAQKIAGMTDIEGKSAEATAGK